ERSYEAHHDALTGLANRRAFYDRVTERFGGIGASGGAAVLLMDLDRFKQINDQLGHEFGDRLLIAFAQRLVATLPKSAVAARLGGDEFAVLLPLDTRSSTPTDASTQLEALHAAMVHPLLIEGFPVSIGASIGVAFAPKHGRVPSDLLRAADVAMYKAKRSGTSIEQFDDSVHLPRRGRIALLSDLGEALTDHQFRVHFQPQLRMSTGHVDTVEALIRWQHPVHGMIPPGEFIDLAEQTDLIGPITEVVLRMSMFGLLASGASGASGVKLAVNVSTRSLQDRYFAPLVFTVLSEAGFPPHQLELEVTERALVTNPERSAYTIERLRDAGVSIAIDDFGKGYSSFETLRQLQVDRVKIDAAFVSGLLEYDRDRAIVEAVIDLSHRLGLEVIAEGVESTEVWEALRSIGCDIAQGFGIAHPMPLPDLKGWLTAWNEVRVEQFVQQAAVTEPPADARAAHRPPIG
ncbi:MAG TPA: bifunctional diguanylate cyclase/phosphodiesterase, partial [Ilumatobacteraceae bacterium]